MKKKVFNTIKQLDIQGYEITMGYKGKGNVHKSYFGSFICLLVYISIAKSTYHKTHDMLYHGNDTIYKNEALMTNEQENKEIHVNSSDFKMTAVILRNNMPVKQKEF